MEIDEVEGNWDMDWWGTLHFNGVQIHAFGSARYGTAALSIEEEQAGVSKSTGLDGGLLITACFTE